MARLHLQGLRDGGEGRDREGGGGAVVDTDHREVPRRLQALGPHGGQDGDGDVVVVGRDRCGGGVGAPPATHRRDRGLEGRVDRDHLGRRQSRLGALGADTLEAQLHEVGDARVGRGGIPDDAVPVLAQVTGLKATDAALGGGEQARRAGIVEQGPEDLHTGSAQRVAVGSRECREPHDGARRHDPQQVGEGPPSPLVVDEEGQATFRELTREVVEQRVDGGPEGPVGQDVQHQVAAAGPQRAGRGRRRVAQAFGRGADAGPGLVGDRHTRRVVEDVADRRA
ncbi:hypothetical protein ASD62_14175 [Phycicoccus sp. Root563]|nr:hypothetical protein ASD62_14175 [Phycicoccus sp. Root563]